MILPQLKTTSTYHLYTTAKESRLNPTGKRKQTKHGQHKPNTTGNTGYYFMCSRRNKENWQRAKKRREEVQVAIKPIHILIQIFPRPKDRQHDPQAKREMVYKIPCRDCIFAYHGQTKRSFRRRIGEHQNTVKDRDPNSNIAQHVKTTNHAIDFAICKNRILNK